MTNSNVGARSVVLVSLASYGGNGDPVVSVSATASNSFSIRICNLAADGSANGAALSAALSINFAVVNTA